MFRSSNLRNEEWLRKMADLEDKYQSSSVGGLVSDLGMLKMPASTDDIDVNK